MAYEFSADSKLDVKGGNVSEDGGATAHQEAGSHDKRPPYGKLTPGPKMPIMTRGMAVSVPAAPHTCQTERRQPSRKIESNS